MSTPQPKWAGLGYQQVPGLANRYIARYLRFHRKSMRRFFAERGMHEFTERMDRIRKSRQGMMEKNRAFQEVLNDYASLVSPRGAPQEPPAAPATTNEGGGMGLPATAQPVPSAPVGLPESDGSRSDAGDSVSPMAGEDAGSGMVIEE